MHRSCRSHFPMAFGVVGATGSSGTSGKKERQGQPPEQATGLPFRFPDSASWLNVAFSCAAGNEAV